MNYIILNQEQRDWLLNLKATTYKDLLQSRAIDFEPIPRKGGIYILPESVLDNPGFAEVKQYLIDDNQMHALIARELTAEEGPLDEEEE
jgi:hypothetical protein